MSPRNVLSMNFWMFRFFFLCQFSFYIDGSSPCDNFTGIGTLHINDETNCFIYFSDPLIWRDSSSACHHHGLHLVFLQTIQKQDWLEEQLDGHGISNKYWTGGHRDNPLWKWYDAELGIFYGEIDVSRVPDPDANAIGRVVVGNSQPMLLVRELVSVPNAYVCEMDGKAPTESNSSMYGFIYTSVEHSNMCNMTSLISASLLHCVIECATEDICDMIRFNQSSNECKLFTHESTNTCPSLSDCVMPSILCFLNKFVV